MSPEWVEWNIDERRVCSATVGLDWICWTCGGTGSLYSITIWYHLHLPSNQTNCTIATNIFMMFNDTVHWDPPNTSVFAFDHIQSPTMSGFELRGHEWISHRRHVQHRWGLRAVGRCGCFSHRTFNVEKFGCMYIYISMYVLTCHSRSWI